MYSGPDLKRGSFGGWCYRQRAIILVTCQLAALFRLDDGKHSLLDRHVIKPSDSAKEAAVAQVYA